MHQCIIVGCGAIAGGYDTPNSPLIRTHAKAYTSHPECHLAGVCDLSADTAKSFALTWGVEISTTCFSELLESTQPNLVSICTQVDSHKILLEQALDAGVNYVWLEKPAAMSSLELNEMAAAVAKSNTQVWVNYFRRYDKGFQQVKESIPSLGEIQYVNAFYTKGLRHNGSHLIDLLHWFFGAVTQVMPIQVISDQDFPMLDALLTVGDVQVNLKSFDYRAFELFELDIIGTAGRIRIHDGGQEIIFEHVVEGKHYSGYHNLIQKSQHDSSYARCMETGLAMALEGQPMPTLDNEKAINQTLDLCSQSVDGKIVF